MELIVFDLETTGLSPTANDIIQIAAVRVPASIPSVSMAPLSR